MDKMAGPNVSFIQRVHSIGILSGNLSTMDKMAGSNVSFIQRVHSIGILSGTIITTEIEMLTSPCMYVLTDTLTH